MDIIKDLPTSEEHPLFFDHLDIWFKAKDRLGLPDVDAVTADDRLSDYRIIAEIEGVRVKYNQVGQKLEKLYGSSLNEKYADEAFGGWFQKTVMDEYNLVREAKLPAYKCLQISTIIKKIGYQKLVLPFGVQDTVTGFVVYILPTDPDIKDEQDWREIVEKTPWL